MASTILNKDQADVECATIFPDINTVLSHLPLSQSP